MKLNIACGDNLKKDFINVDLRERKNKLDEICDITREWKWGNDSCEYIYAEQFIEHLTWLEGKKFLMNCYRTLKEGGILRLVLPDYEKIFRAYLEEDNEFFKVFFEGLNRGDLTYYHKVYLDPEGILKERINNPPPKWHTSKKPEDRKRLEERVRHYKFNIEIVDWFCHQYQEHKCLYDFDSLESVLLRIGFSTIKQTDIKDIDSHAPTRITSSLYVEAIK